MGVFIRRDLEAEGDPDVAERLRKQALDMWDLELRGHFEVEESVLFPAARAAIPTPDVVDQLIEEHRAIEAALVALRHASRGNLRKRLLALRELLVRHIRTEETVLFESVQDSLGEDDLETLRQRIAETLPTVCVNLGSAAV